MDVKRDLRLPIYGLDCPGTGPAAIERELASADGVLTAYVNPVTETAYVEYDDAKTDPLLLARAIEKAGYRSGPPIEP